jgi:hypothetical protein
VLLVLFSLVVFNILSSHGKVWFPNSAFKTAQAIKDMNKEQLPLMIFANWRGFSGTLFLSFLFFCRFLFVTLSLSLSDSHVQVACVTCLTRF